MRDNKKKNCSNSKSKIRNNVTTVNRNVNQYNTFVNVTSQQVFGQEILEWLNTQGYNFEYLTDSQINVGDPR